MPVAEIITIGTEILLGEIVDTNTRFLAINLKDAGIDLYRTMTVGDNPGRISAAIREAKQRADIVITTGGLGPTIDDPTRQAVAEAVGRQLAFLPELWQQIQERFQRYGRQANENNRRQAYVPEGSIVIENPVGTAPAFITEVDGCVVISLPGVPREMEFLVENAIVPYLRQKFTLKGTIRTRVLHTAAVGESQIDERIGDLEVLPNPTVGLSAHPGQIDIRITAKAGSSSEAQELIHEVEEILRSRLGDWIYGADADTLEKAITQQLKTRGWKLVILEGGSGGMLLQKMIRQRPDFAGGETLSEITDQASMTLHLEELRRKHRAEAGLSLYLQPAGDRHVLSIIIQTPDGNHEINRSYGGPPLLAAQWAASIALDALRRFLITSASSNIRN